MLTAIKGPKGNHLNLLRNGNLLEIVTVNKSILSDILEGLGQLNTLQSPAELKGSWPDNLEGFWKIDLTQLPAFHESRLSNLLHRTRHTDRHQLRAASECVFSNRHNRGSELQPVDFCDIHACLWPNTSILAPDDQVLNLILPGNICCISVLALVA